jgi:serine/threonine protein kinase
MINKQGEYVFIDFGISKKIKELLSGLDTYGRKTKGFIGTPRYASIQAHKGREQSKKDDL